MPQFQSQNHRANQSPAVQRNQRPPRYDGNVGAEASSAAAATQPLTPFGASFLQRTVGNQALGASSAGAASIVQPSLLLGPVDTPAEREAEAVARGLDAPKSRADTSTTRPSDRSAASIVQRAANLGGGAVEPQVATEIEAQRGKGQALDPLVRRSMEDGLGADFSGVRVHVDAQADQLNRSLQAQAFTTGSDIFFRQSHYKPATDGGRRLLAHELTHVVQQNGTGGGVQRRGLIQRAVGFEFEAGNWTLYKLNAPLTKNQSKGDDPVPKTQLTDFGIEKGVPIHKEKGWAFTADHSEDMHVEFVTDSPGFQEGKDGRKKLVTAMKSMKAFGDKMIKAKPKAKINVEGGMLSLPLHTVTSKAPKDILMTPRSELDAEPQTTAGIRLSQLAQMMDSFYKGRFTDKTDEENQDRAMGNQLLWGKQPRDQEVVGDSPDAVRAAWDDIGKRYPDVKVGRFTGLPALSPSAVAIASAMRSYLITAAGAIAYAKSLAPLMARTDFATMFQFVSGDDGEFFRAQPNFFVGLVLESAGMRGTEDEPVFAGKATHIDPDVLDELRRMSRKYWISNVVKGTDYLTTENFPVENVDQALFGLGGLGDKVDTVGGDKQPQHEAPVFEFRRMQGRIEHYAWPTLAEEIFDWISRVNQGSGEHFSGARTREARASGGKKRK
jgi:hypothetical protein